MTSRLARHRRSTLLAGVLGGSLLGLVACNLLDPHDSAAGTAQAAPPSAAAPAEASSTAAALPTIQAQLDARRTPVVQAVERVAPAVVSITTQVPNDDPFARLRGAPRTEVSEGSGVVIQSDGVVLTNAHVVSRASRIEASFADGSSYEADILGLATELDLAVLKLRDAEGLTTVELGSSQDLLLGEPVIAIGNPFGLGHTVTTGVISATQRPLQTEERVYQDFLQTDASINPGNSGGPLLDIHGRLIGINTAIRPDAQGIGFAIPVDRAIKVADDLSRYGQVQAPWLGVDLEDVYIRADVGGSPAGTSVDRSGRRTAARVVAVHPLAAQASDGLRVGDIIVAVQGRNVQGRGDLNAFLAGQSIGDEVALSVRRPDGDRWTPLELALAAATLPDEAVSASLSARLGLRIGTGSHRAGVLIEAVSATGAFAAVGGRVGDRIAAINGRPVFSDVQLRAAIAAAKSAHRGAALVTVRRGGALHRIELPL